MQASLTVPVPTRPNLQSNVCMLPKCAVAVFRGDCGGQASGRVYKDQLATELTLGNERS